MLKKIFILSVLTGCLGLNFTYASPLSKTSSGSTEVNSTSPNYYASKWYRDSAERNAIYREIYFMAEQHIREKVASNQLKPHQWGVVLDIDETVLDNSQWNHEQALHNESGSWDNFASKGISVPTPGAKKFLHDIHLMGGYINLDAQGMYFDQVLLDTTNTGTSFVNKNPRFEAIITGKSPSTLPPQKIIACFGDNIQDFPAHLQKQMINENSNGKAYNSFGVTDFVLPNPMYGSWEKNKFN